MKIARIITTCVALILLISVLVSCAPSIEDITGTYIGEYDYNGDHFRVAIILFDDGTYAKATAKNGVISSSELGDFEIKGNKIRLYEEDTDHGVWMEYKYSQGVLTNNKHKFIKEED